MIRRRAGIRPWAAICLAASVVGLLPINHVGGADQGKKGDACEVEARRAYWQALKICQLAENSDPRLRCFEAAKAVYIQTFLDCQKKTPGSR